MAGDAMTLAERIDWIVARSRSSAKAHAKVYRWTAGRIGGRKRGIPVLLLTTTGRRSGQPRTVPLMYLPHEGQMVVVAANAGSDASPAWWLNLRRSPRAVVQVRGERRDVVAREADTSERAALWPELVDLNPFYARYQAVTPRSLAVVILEVA